MYIAYCIDIVTWSLSVFLSFKFQTKYCIFILLRIFVLKLIQFFFYHQFRQCACLSCVSHMFILCQVYFSNDVFQHRGVTINARFTGLIFDVAPDISQTVVFIFSFYFEHLRNDPFSFKMIQTRIFAHFLLLFFYYHHHFHLSSEKKKIDFV